MVTEHSPDAALVARTLDGDERAFELLVRRYRRVALARALAVLSDPEDAEDVVQDAFIEAHDQLRTLRDPARVGPWLMTAVRNRALNTERSRRRRRTVAIEDDLPLDAHQSTDRQLMREDMRRELLLALRRLSGVQREVVLLADLEGCAHAEIARLLGISVLMSRRHLSDARQRLRDYLTPKDR
jgi:RNA polymerase sigma-70 factor, ECF subfamily